MLLLGPCCGLGGADLSRLPSILAPGAALLSLLPAHIAMEMAEIIQRLQGPKSRQMENTNNFHNLPCQAAHQRQVRHRLPSSARLEPSAGGGCGVADVGSGDPVLKRHVPFGVVHLGASIYPSTYPCARASVIQIKKTGPSTCCILGPAVTKGRVSGGAFILGTLRSDHWVPGTQDSVSQ